MATSIVDLLDVLDQETSRRTGRDSRDAAGALGRAGRLLARLRADGIGDGPAPVRDDAARRLAGECAEAALAFETGPGRISDLVGVTSDAVGRRRRDLSDEDRWTVATALAPITRRCAQVIAGSGPYVQVPQLLGVIDRSGELTRAAALSPADPSRLIGQHLPIPDSGLLPRGTSPARVAAEAMAELVTRLHAAGDGPVGVRNLLGACRAAETVAHAGATITPPGRLLGHAPSAALAWRRLRAELTRFTDRPHRDSGPADQTLLCAMRVHANLSRTLDAQLSDRQRARARPGADTESIRAIVRLLPTIATAVEHQLHRPTAWIVAGGPRPLHERRVAEWLQHRPFLARGEDLYPAISALHQVARESAQLTAALNPPARQTVGLGARTLRPPASVPLRF